MTMRHKVHNKAGDDNILEKVLFGVSSNLNINRMALKGVDVKEV